MAVLLAYSSSVNNNQRRRFVKRCFSNPSSTAHSRLTSPRNLFTSPKNLLSTGGTPALSRTLFIASSAVKLKLPAEPVADCLATAAASAYTIYTPGNRNHDKRQWRQIQ